MSQPWLVPDRIKHGETGGNRLPNVSERLALLGPRPLSSFVRATNRTQMKDPDKPTQKEITSIVHFAAANKTGNGYELASIAFVLARSKRGVPWAMLIEMSADHTITLPRRRRPGGARRAGPPPCRQEACYIDPWLKPASTLAPLGGIEQRRVVTAVCSPPPPGRGAPSPPPGTGPGDSEGAPASAGAPGTPVPYPDRVRGGAMRRRLRSSPPSRAA